LQNYSQNKLTNIQNVGIKFWLQLRQLWLFWCSKHQVVCSHLNHNHHLLIMTLNKWSLLLHFLEVAHYNLNTFTQVLVMCKLHINVVPHITHICGALILLQSTATSANTWKNVFQVCWWRRSKLEKKGPKSMDNWNVNGE
jgi:hypothetical protein